MGNADKRAHLARLFESAAGPLTWHDDDNAEGSCGDVPVWLATHTSNIGSGNRVITGAEVSVDLGARTIAMLIDDRARTHPSLPEVRTGDATFDDRYLVQGWPPEALTSGFDEAVRSWVTDSWPHGWPPITAEPGRLSGRLTVFRHDGGDRVMVEGEFRRHVDGLVALGGGLMRGYDEQRARIVAGGGEAAGGAWDADLRAMASARERRRGALRAMVFGGLFLLCLAVIAAVLAGAGLL